MKHMKIGMRLALGFGAVIILVVAMAGMSLTRLAEMQRITEDIVTKDWQKTVLVMAFFTLAESTRAQDSTRTDVSMSTPIQPEKHTGDSSSPGAGLPKAKPGAVPQGRPAQHGNSHQHALVTSNGAESDWIEF